MARRRKAQHTTAAACRTSDADLLKDLLSAEGRRAILAALAAVKWRQSGGKGAPHVPAAADLASACAEPDAYREARALAADVVGAECVDIYAVNNGGGVFFITYGAVLPVLPAGAPADLAQWRAWMSNNPVSAQDLMLLRWKKWAADNRAALRDLPNPDVLTIEGMHAAWQRARDGGATVPHPLGPLVLECQNRPQPAEWKRHDPILPRITVGAPGPERERGERLLSCLAPTKQEQLPLLQELHPDDAAAAVPLLELADAHGAQSIARGRGAPLDLRLVVESVLSVSYELRERESVRIAWTVDELLAAAFPNGYHLARSGRRPGDWTRMRAAVLS